MNEGDILKKHLKSQDINIQEFSEKVGIGRTKLYSLFVRAELPEPERSKIIEVIGRNIFHIKEENDSTEEIMRMKDMRIADLQELVAVYKEKAIKLEEELNKCQVQLSDIKKITPNNN